MKILLNCLPPADIHTPSISLSILKSFMNENGTETELKYWNFMLSPMQEYCNSEDTDVRLIPFLSLLNDRNDNDKGNKRILSFLQQLQPEYKTHGNDYYAEFLEDTKADIVATIASELQQIDFSDIGIFGISAKYNQWIPGMLLAEMVKKIAPHITVLVGGFGNAHVAREAMQLCKYFDLATWGEGEYPLLNIYHEVEKDKKDFALLPRLIYRQDGELKQSLTQKSQYLDFENYLYPDYSDFINTYPHQDDMDEVSIPINTIRSCNWSKCKFCDFNQGYKLRKRSPECIVREIEHIYNEYELTTFSFVDSDTFGDIAHFEELLDRIIDLKLRSGDDFVFWSEIIPNKEFTGTVFEKMSIAGFKNIFIGYDGLSNSMLSKMSKSNTFSDNLFFVKQSIKHGIAPYVNVIKHLPDETEEDVQECIENLHFTRFFYNDPTIDFSHNYVNLVLSSMSKYYKIIPQEEHKSYDFDMIPYLVPDYFPEGENRFHLFRYESNIPANRKEWEKLEEIESFYKDNSLRYRIQVYNNVLYYTEYSNDEEIENFIFEAPEYLAVLKATEHQVLSFEELLDTVKATLPQTTPERLAEVLSHLKDAHIIYCNKQFSDVVSLVDL